jgi:hypothetical protein
MGICEVRAEELAAVRNSIGGAEFTTRALAGCKASATVGVAPISATWTGGQVKNVKPVMLVFLALGVGACATPYQEPKSGPTATLVFSTEGVMPKPLKGAAASLFMEPTDCSDQRDIGIAESGKDLRVRVAADRDVAAQMGYTLITGVTRSGYQQMTTHLNECHIIVSFRPVEGHVYRFTYRQRDRKCSLNGTDLDKGGAGPGARLNANYRVRLAGDRKLSDPHCLRLPPP